MGRKSAHDLPEGIHKDKHGVFWATLAGEYAQKWRDRYPGRTLPRRKAPDLNTALRIQRRLMRDLDTGRDSQAENPTVIKYVEAWIANRLDIQASTRKRYQQSLEWQIKPHRIGRLRLSEVSKSDVQEWVITMTKQASQRDPSQKLDPYTIRNAFALFRAVFNTAMEDDAISKNPCYKVRLPAIEDDEIQPLTPDEVIKLFNLLEHHQRIPRTDIFLFHRNTALYHLAVRLGLREGELLGLIWKNLDIKRKRLYVWKQMQKGEHKGTKTKPSKRVVPISEDILNMLLRHKKNQQEERSISHNKWNEGDLIFCSENGTPIAPNNLGRQFASLLRRAELPQIRFHDLRHTYAALSLAAGTDLFTLSRRMGHSSIKTTADLYGHLYEGENQGVQEMDILLQREVLDAIPS